MKKARYNIELHGRGGCYKIVPLEGTRIEARQMVRKLVARAKEKNKGCSPHITFVRYLDAVA